MIGEYYENSTHSNGNCRWSRQTSWRAQMLIFNQIWSDNFMALKSTKENELITLNSKTFHSHHYNRKKKLSKVKFQFRYFHCRIYLNIESWISTNSMCCPPKPRKKITFLIHFMELVLYYTSCKDSAKLVEANIGHDEK